MNTPQRSKAFEQHRVPRQCRQCPRSPKNKFEKHWAFLRQNNRIRKVLRRAPSRRTYLFAYKTVFHTLNVYKYVLLIAAIKKCAACREVYIATAIDFDNFLSTVRFLLACGGKLCANKAVGATRRTYHIAHRVFLPIPGSDCTLEHGRTPYLKRRPARLLPFNNMEAVSPTVKRLDAPHLASYDAKTSSICCSDTADKCLKPQVR